MSDYFVNVNNSYPDDIGHDGSTGNRFSFAEANAHSYANPTGNIYNCAGKWINILGCGTYLYIMGNTWQSDDPHTNGPCIIVGDLDVSVYIEIDGFVYGILFYASLGIILSGIAKNCLFNPGSGNKTLITSQSVGQTSIWMEGCSFYEGLLNSQGVVPCSVDFYDCAISAVSLIGTEDTWIAYRSSLVGPGFYISVVTGSQTGWTMPACPIHTAAKAAFSNLILMAGTTTPPQPGNPPYGDYATGLWGEARTGIGAVWFAPVPPLDVFNIGIDWLKHPTQGLEPFRTPIQYPGSGIRLRNISDEIQIKFTASFTNVTKTIQNSLLSYFNSHKGRLNAFWVPVPKNYFFATSNIGASDTTIQIKDVSPVWLRGYERMFIVDQFSNFYHAKINNLTSSTMVIDAPLGAISKSNISMFGKLIWARFDMDEIQMHYISPGISECDLSFIELPKEYV
jgi:hypothetical protein